MPVHALLGGRLRDSAVVYSNAWYFGAQTADEFAQRAAQTVAEGYRALKFDPFGSAGLTISEAELANSIGRVAASSSASARSGRCLFGTNSRLRCKKKSSAKIET
jgi:galactonate dehydratase